MIVYDCEIINAIKPKKASEVRKDIKYCDGWEDYKGMGVSCVGLYDTVKRSHYMACATPMLESLLKETGLPYELTGIKDIHEVVSVVDVLVGFNNLKFDKNLMKANGFEFNLVEYDIIQEVWAAVGLSPVFNYRTHGGFSLGDIASANFGMEKTGDGGNAPLLYQTGRYRELADYCHNDIVLTVNVLELILMGKLKNPKNGKILKVRIPYEI